MTHARIDRMTTDQLEATAANYYKMIDESEKELSAGTVRMIIEAIYQIEDELKARANTNQQGS